jgi:hypothetical protein
MATSLRKWIISITLLLFLVMESGCVGIIVGAVVIKKKRARARAAAEEVKAEQNPSTIVPQTVTPTDDTNTVEVPAPKPVPANAETVPAKEEKPEIVPASITEQPVSILTQPVVEETPLSALRYLGLAFGFIFVSVLAARVIQIIRRS